MVTQTSPMTELVSNEPNAAHLFESLRYSGYSNEEAIADIVDNCFDAQANNVWIQIDDVGNDKRIIIADDGVGMNINQLDEALRLGSNSDKSLTTQLGKAGMGLKTAGTSIAKTIDVFTKQEGIPSIYYSSYDGKLIVEKNAWLKVLTTITRPGLENFDLDDSFPIHDSTDRYRPLSDQGTVVVLRDCDRFTSQKIGHFEKRLIKHLGEVYRKFLSAGKQILVNDKPVPINDPLYLVGADTTYFKDEAPKVHDRTINLTIDSRKISFDVKVSVLPEVSAGVSKILELGMKNQGFYIMRNNRQIARAETLGIFNKHNDFNRVRAEILFDGTVDEFMGINFAKKEIQPKQAIIDSITALIYNPIFTLVKKESSANSRLEVVKQKEVKHDVSEKIFEKKGSLLIKPIKQKIEQEEIEQKVEELKKEYEELKDFTSSSPLKFINDSKMAENDVIFKAEQVGETTLIRLNVKHPFFKVFIDLEDDAKEPIELLIGALAMSKLRLSEDLQNIIEEELLRSLSLNLRQLLS